MSLLATNRQSLRTQYEGRFGMYENRKQMYGMLNMALESMNNPMNILSQSARELGAISNDTALFIPVLDRENRTPNATRSCAITDFENTSALAPITWNTLSLDISMVPGQYQSNDINYQFDLEKKLFDAENAIALAIENAIVARLEADKSQVNESSFSGTKYPFVADASQVSLAQQPLFFNDLRSMMYANDLDGSIYVAHSLEMESNVNLYVNQGSGNSQNQQFQFSPYTFFGSKSVANGVGVLSTGYALPEGSIGILFRVPVDHLEGRVSKDASWELFESDIVGVPLAVLYKDGCADSSGISGGKPSLSASYKQLWQLSIDYAIVTPYNSDPATQSGTIHKFEFMAI